MSSLNPNNNSVASSSSLPAHKGCIYGLQCYLQGANPCRDCHDVKCLASGQCLHETPVPLAHDKRETPSMRQICPRNDDHGPCAGIHAGFCPDPKCTGCNKPPVPAKIGACTRKFCPNPLCDKYHLGRTQWKLGVVVVPAPTPAEPAATKQVIVQFEDPDMCTGTCQIMNCNKLHPELCQYANCQNFVVYGPGNFTVKTGCGHVHLLYNKTAYFIVGPKIIRVIDSSCTCHEFQRAFTYSKFEIDCAARKVLETNLSDEAAAPVTHVLLNPSIGNSFSLAVPCFNGADCRNRRNPEKPCRHPHSAKVKRH